MAFQYPPKPWVDGQEIKMRIGHKEVVVAKYDASKNLWQHLQVNEKGVFTYAYACEILIDRSKCPADPCLETISWDNIKDVQTALDWIYLRLQELFEKVELLEKRVKQNEVDIDWLYQTLSAIDNLADVSELLEKLEELDTKLDNLNAADINQGTLDSGKFSMKSLPDGVAQGTQQETNYFLADLIESNDEYLIWFGSEPPTDPLYKFWWHTERLELLISFNDQWWPVSIPPDQRQALTEIIEGLEVSVTQVRGDIALNKIDIDELRQDIVDGEFRPNLEQVLEQGNIADKGFVLTNLENDAILVSPEQARIMVGGVGPSVVPSVELRHETGIQDTSLVKLELDEDGQRFDIECDEKVDNIHFRFENNVKFELNKKGDAVFNGKVQAEPGTKDNELVTYGQLLTVEEELEQLAPSLERGTWTYTSDSNPGPGEYTLIKLMLTKEDQETLCNEDYQQCIIDAAGDLVAQTECNRIASECTRDVVPEGKIVTTDQFAEADQILFNAIDSEGVEHEFKGIDDDHLLDLFNEDNDAFGVFDILTHGGGLFDVDVLSTRGTAVDLARLKIFKHEGAVDFDQYVRKQGDTMTGELKIVDENNNPAIATQPDNVTTKAYVDQTSPIGTIVFWGGTIAKIPTGWVECRGQLAPESVKQITGLPYIPNLKDYMPAGAGGKFGANVGSYEQSKIKKHSHSWGGPADRKGYPSGSKDTSEGTANNQSYWRGNKYDSATSSYGSTSTTGQDITAPPVYIGVYIMRVS